MKIISGWIKDNSSVLSLTVETFTLIVTLCVSVQVMTINNTVNSYNNNVVNNYNNSYNEATDKDALLDYAQTCFLGEDYAEVARVYSIEKLKDISIVNTNLGYMFANGLYFKTDYEMAGEYYDKAIAMNSEQAINNKLAMYLRTHDVRAAELIYKGCELRDEKVIDFFMLHFEDKINLSEEEKVDFIKETLDGLDEEGKYNLLYDTFQFWTDEGLVALYSVPDKNNFEKYEFIRFGDDSAGTYMIYKKSVSHCKFIEILNEGFEIR